jgi:hypothetical protein
VQTRGDLFVRQTVGNQRSYFALAGRQRPKAGQGWRRVRGHTHDDQWLTKLGRRFEVDSNAGLKLELASQSDDFRQRRAVRIGSLKLSNHGTQLAQRGRIDIGDGALLLETLFKATGGKCR